MREIVGKWTTPSASDGERGGSITPAMSGTSLTQQVNTLWSTPRATDGEKGGPNQSFRNGTGLPLPSQAHQWATPTSLSYGESHQPGNSRSQNINMDLARELYSRLAQVTVKTGKPHSKERRSLNPLFVEWLMGWPPGWTLVAWTDLGCSATALSRYRQRMRFALSQLALPVEAPPAQLALFG
ncbi:hypothetical protein [Mesorhizobium sp.]|uniref:hypothetical protein n=1 Tax=Mesorhizobium sp. TaxID=1871066 RepID=UPI00257B45D7|nr:hypothetical protein [Mesorhizobium sp.]